MVVKEAYERKTALTEASRLKMSLARRGKHHSEASKLKMSLARRGKHHSEETKRKISLSTRGKLLSDETKRKIGLGNSRSWARKRLEDIEKFTDYFKRLHEVNKELSLEKKREFLRKLYGISDGDVFYPAPLRDHLFVVKVLRGRACHYSYLEHTGLNEIPYLPLRYRGDKGKQRWVRC